MYGGLAERLQLIELAAYFNRTKVFNMNCNNNNNTVSCLQALCWWPKNNNNNDTITHSNKCVDIVNGSFQSHRVSYPCALDNVDRLCMVMVR